MTIEHGEIIYTIMFIMMVGEESLVIKFVL
jgi:hypothetical protein